MYGYSVKLLNADRRVNSRKKLSSNDSNQSFLRAYVKVCNWLLSQLLEFNLMQSIWVSRYCGTKPGMADEVR